MFASGAGARAVWVASGAATVLRPNWNMGGRGAQCVVVRAGHDAKCVPAAGLVPVLNPTDPLR